MKVSELKTAIKQLVRESLDEKTKPKKEKKWLQKAVDPKHEGDCTPMSKSTCTPSRKAFAKRAKKGFEENSVQKDYEADNEHMRRMEDETVTQTPGKYVDAKGGQKDVNWIKHTPNAPQQKEEMCEVAPPGFGPGKQHADIYNKVKSQYKGNDQAAYATMWKIHNKMSEAMQSALAECGVMDECGTCEEGGNSNIPKGKLAQLNPGIVKKGGFGKMNLPPSKPDNKKVKESGLTSEGPDAKLTPMDDIARFVIQRKGANDPAKVEYLVGKVFQAQWGKEADPAAVKAAVERNLDYKPIQGNELKENVPFQQPNATDKNWGAQYSVRNGSSQVEVPGKIDRARQVQKSPRVNENIPTQQQNAESSDWGAQYSVRDGSSQVEVPGKINRARQIQKNPKVNETAYKVQGPSYKTQKDSPKGDTAYKDDPKNR